MKIGFDARMIRHSGIGTYIRGILKFLTEKENLDFTLFGDLSKIADYHAKKVLADFPIYSVREQVFFPALLKKEPCDLFHVPHYNAPVGFKGNLVVTIHDLIHLKFPPSRIAYFYARGMLEAVCRKAKVLIADSLNTRKDIARMIGVREDKIKVVYPAVGEEFSPVSEKKAEDGKQPYLLYVGNIRPAKNIKVLMDAFMLAKEKIRDLRLVLAGKNSMPEFTKQFENDPDIRFFGEISHSKLKDLYRGAKIFVFPSLYEGFGLPPLEAMASGVPVICSRAASLPEVVGDAALLFDPEKAGEIADLVRLLWNDDSKRRELAAKGTERAKKFSWKRTSDEIEKIYGECA